MSDENGSVEIIESVIITTSPDDFESRDALVSEKDITEAALNSDPLSPATAVPKKGVTLPSDDEDVKVILNLEISNTQNIDEELKNNGKEDDVKVKTLTPNEVACMQLENLAPKSRNKSGIKDVNSAGTVEVVRISKADTSTDGTEKKLRIVSVTSKELIKSEEAAEATPKKILNRNAPDSSEDIDEKGAELIAILEGEGRNSKHDSPDDSGELYEFVELPGSNPNHSSLMLLTKQEEQKIALEQMLSIPKNRRRRKTKQESAAIATDLVNSLVSDWSDTEKDIETKPVLTLKKEPEVKIIKKEPTPGVTKTISAPVVTPFKRTRIIKKKIIWDPDAPETQISYASLVQSSAKKPVRKTPAPTQPPVKTESVVLIKQEQPQPKVKILNTGKRSATPLVLNNKKKKLTEIDRLLNDEGAANMISSLETEVPLLQKEPRPKREQAGAVQEKQVKKEPTTTPKKRATKGNASSSWDYVYNQRNVDSLIIRRRSNSSYSSTTSPRRMSLDKTTPVQTKGKTRKNFEFAKPEVKKTNKKSPDVSADDNPMAQDIKRIESKESVRKSNRSSTALDSSNSVSSNLDKVIDDVVLKRHGHVVQFILKPKVEKIKNSFTVQLMKSIVSHLETLRKDNSCRVVVFTSAGQQFCHGIDFLSLTQGNAEKRRSAAVELAATVKNFLHALLTFPKPLLAGVIGSCSGIGVTMLPLFDVVIASDKSTFETPYAKIGQLPEGNCILSLTNNVRHNFKTKLLWLSEKLNSTEAALSGLVSKLTAPIKVTDDTLLCAKRIALQSQQSFTAMKAQKSEQELKVLSDALQEEQKVLVNHWMSTECQEKFKHYITKENW